MNQCFPNKKPLTQNQMGCILYEIGAVAATNPTRNSACSRRLTVWVLPCGVGRRASHSWAAFRPFAARGGFTTCGNLPNFAPFTKDAGVRNCGYVDKKIPFPP